MAGSRWFARDAVASMGWWCLIIFAIGGCCGVLAADVAAMEPNSAGAAGGEEGECYRPLSDVIWGFLVTLLALTVSLWGSLKYIGEDSLNPCVPILAAILIPLLDLISVVRKSLRCVSLLWVCHKMEYPNSRITSYSWLKFLCSSLFPWSKSSARILASCDIVVYVSNESPLLEKKWLWTTMKVKDESEAMVVGENGQRATRNDQYVRLRLSEEGLAFWVWKEVFFKAEECKRLPKFDELKYLRGNSGFAVIAIAVQAFGYIYASSFRLAKNLRISPLEAIGLVFNILLLIKVFSYSTCNPCHRPLVIYLDGDWEHEVGELDNNDQKKFELYDISKVLALIFFGIFVVLSTLLIYCIVNIVEATNVMVALPVILFLIGQWIGILGLLIGEFIATIGFLLTAMAYIWAIVGTVLYWRTMHFNTRADLINLSQIIPFVG